MALATSAITASGTIPSLNAAANTANLAVNPLVSGIPARASSRNVMIPAVIGERLDSPAHWDSCVASPSASRTRLITPNTASVVNT